MLPSFYWLHYLGIKIQQSPQACAPGSHLSTSKRVDKNRQNCRTSAEMVEKYYASHISISISAAAVNVKRKAKSKKQIIEHAKRNAHRA
jgi:hypothetical protein